MPDDEVHARELPDDLVVLGGDAVRAVAGVQQDHHPQLGADPKGRPQPVQGPVRPVGVHVGVQLHHLEAVLPDVELELLGPVLRAEPGVVGEVSDEPVGVALHQLHDVGHVVADALPASPHAVLPYRVAGRRLDAAVIDPPRLAVHPVRAVHHLEHPLAGERLPVVAPSLVDDVGGMEVGVDDHWGPPWSSLTTIV